MDSLLMWTGALVWGAMIGVCWVIVCLALPYALLDFISKTIAAWQLIGKGRVSLKPGWTRIGVAADWAWLNLLDRKCYLHSGNDWLVTLYYAHPLKWEIVSHWDHIDGSDDDEDEDDA